MDKKTRGFEMYLQVNKYIKIDGMQKKYVEPFRKVLVL